MSGLSLFLGEEMKCSKWRRGDAVSMSLSLSLSLSLSRRICPLWLNRLRQLRQLKLFQPFLSREHRLNRVEL